ncbi:hypothetical protein BV22DRAFT_1048347 [Leucogyrophana mollusca]|uniref:Uncharacterized protein n=1 Tax=Leucogyrophana mollusca TaxID=85980 RepID=A0ACB8BCE7_9AGAM|nr:hypothetical protein BV22DRAFT_1048347 [Leucogyrophana mollusca]
MYSTIPVVMESEEHFVQEHWGNASGRMGQGEHWCTYRCHPRHVSKPSWISVSSKIGNFGYRNDGAESSCSLSDSHYGSGLQSTVSLRFFASLAHAGLLNPLTIAFVFAFGAFWRLSHRRLVIERPTKAPFRFGWFIGRRRSTQRGCACWRRVEQYEVGETPAFFILCWTALRSSGAHAHLNVCPMLFQNLSATCVASIKSVIQALDDRFWAAVSALRSFWSTRHAAVTGNQQGARQNQGGFAWRELRSDYSLEGEQQAPKNLGSSLKATRNPKTPRHVKHQDLGAMENLDYQIHSSRTDSSTRFNDLLDLFPMELVIRIFATYVAPRTREAHRPPETDPKAPVTLCGVSKRWKDLVYSLPEFWTVIGFDATVGAAPWVSDLNFWLTRSASHLLTVDVSVGDRPDVVALDALFAHSARFRSLTLTATSFSWWKDIKGGPFPKLQRLFTQRHPRVRGPSESFLPLLYSHGLITYRHPTTGVDALLPLYGHRMRRLMFEGTYPPPSGIFPVLLACPLLEELDLTVTKSTESATGLPSFPAPVLLTELAVLAVRSSAGSARFFQHLETPGLQILVLSGTQDSPSLDGLETGFLLLFLRRCARLTCLIVIGDFFQKEESLDDVISQLPSSIRLIDLRLAVTERTVALLTIGATTRPLLPNLKQLGLTIREGCTDEKIVNMVASRRANGNSLPSAIDSDSASPTTRNEVAVARLSYVRISRSPASDPAAMLKLDGMRSEGLAFGGTFFVPSG